MTANTLLYKQIHGACASQQVCPGCTQWLQLVKASQAWAMDIMPFWRALQMRPSQRQSTQHTKIPATLQCTFHLLVTAVEYVLAIYHLKVLGLLRLSKEDMDDDDWFETSRCQHSMLGRPNGYRIHVTEPPQQNTSVVRLLGK